MTARDEHLRQLVHGARILVGGVWRPSGSGTTFEVQDPQDGAAIAVVGDADRADAAEAVAAAAAAGRTWGMAPNRERYEVLTRAARLLEARREPLAQVITAESGKPIVEARQEAVSTFRFFDWYAQEALRMAGEHWTEVSEGRDAIVRPEPIGVVAAITPWNYPAFLVACKAAAALAAGCGVVLKPAEQTPLSALAIGRALDEAGLPPGVLSVIPTSRPERLGDVLLGPGVDCVSFTGSREVGELLLDRSAHDVKRVLLELGGNAPAIVLDDADVDRAVTALIRARFMNGGQTCVAVNRIYVTPGIADRFATAYAEAAARLRVGPSEHESTELGPLIEPAAIDRISAQVGRLVEQGGRIATGGGRPDGMGERYFAATVVLGDGSEPEASREELFGPVAFVQRCQDEADAIRRANDSEYGLSAYLFTEDLGHALEVSRRLVAGSVAINGPLASEVQLPFGGMRASGLGRERGRAGLEAFLELKTVHIVK
ncbi:MAG: hypothetical protein BGO95_00625 [Micrococcales bacterium 73-13]|nr:MAG: hypothetical protein BGO95_00625 [Micrococcales bacterium 73-13]